jgi:hypothetical protein
MSRDLRLKLFHVGAAAFSRYRGTSDDVAYACPICARLFGESAAKTGELTLEHVPPRSMGGPPLILTCRSCNSVAGHTVDAEAARAEQVKVVAAAMEMRQALNHQRGRIELHGERLRGDFSIDPASRTITFNVRSQVNDPAAFERSMAANKEHVAEGRTDANIKITPAIRWRPVQAHISHLRAAFLAGFAAFGYSFAFEQGLSLVRKQIRNPEVMLGPGFSLATVDSARSNAEITVITAPIEGLAIWIEGRPFVFPRYPDDVAFYDRLGQLFEQGTQRLTMQDVDKPQGFALAWDTALNTG